MTDCDPSYYSRSSHNEFSPVCTIYTSRSARVADKIIHLSVSADALHPSWGGGARGKNIEPAGKEKDRSCQG